MTKTEMLMEQSSGPGRPKYKQMWQESRSEYAKCRLQLQDCECFIKEAKIFLRDHQLDTEFNQIMNEKYGWSLYSTVSRI